jgi:ferredoxin/flavodoxin---NADP+ reductase
VRRVAVIGSGPSGFYAVEALLEQRQAITIDLFEALPTPFGLVRHGVAPDHQKLKQVDKAYSKILADSRVRFVGNVKIGTELRIDTLRSLYAAVLVATGAQNDRKLGISGEDLPGVHSARSFIAWYNGHPSFDGHTFDLSTETAAVVGVGNVALDVARILAKPVDDLRSTDIADRALDALATSKIREIHLIGRKHPGDAKFSPKELRELESLDSVAVELRVDPAQAARTNWTEPVPAALKAAVAHAVTRPRRKIVFHFGTRPTAFLGAAHLDALRLHGDTGESELSCGISFRSIGYFGDPVPGIPFDASTGRIPNALGRVLPAAGELSPVYVAGWAKRGPSGIIGTNRADSRETVSAMLADLDPGSLVRVASPQLDPLLSLELRPDAIVDLGGWISIDQFELEQGRLAGRCRRKLTTLSELMAATGRRTGIGAFSSVDA